ncbi:MAG TPA: dihydroorotate dehydrogenase-like protein [Armatimonadetes bacterium]|nr:dihydroorotate dehydrogenase-like protein [Armatimonadota bacterium]
MDLKTTYLGLELAHPFMPGASIMSEELDTVRALEDAGASAIVLHSLFEEQIRAEQGAALDAVEGAEYRSAEATSFFPGGLDMFRLGPNEYLEHIAKVKAAVGIPVIASLNGATKGGWLHYAELMEQAGADALELNVYYLATDLDKTGLSIRTETMEMVTSVKSAVKIPVALKLSPFYTSMANTAKELDGVNVDGLIMFNRFYQPDIDVEELEVVRSLHLSDSSELLLRLRWLAILSGRVQASLAVSGGVHTVLDAVKSVMCGAHAVQLVSALLKNGPSYLRSIIDGVGAWLEDHEYDSLEQMQGSMSLLKAPDPDAYERANYASVLRSWRR